jgi:hypothetical protein
MNILILYILLIVFLFLKIKIFKIFSVLFCFIYLPGLLLVLSKKEKIVFHDMILAFPVSLGISSLLTLGFLYAGVNAESLVFIFYAIAGILLFSGIVKGKNINMYISKNEAIFACISLLLTLIFSLPVFSDRIAISTHGFHHFSIITQVINGIFPPENPGMGGAVLNYLWGYHAFIAALSSPTGINPLRIISILNIVSLFFIFAIAYQFARSLGFKEGYCYLVSLAVIGLMRSDVFLFFLKGLIKGTIPATNMTLGLSNPLEIIQNWIIQEGAPWVDRRLMPLNKFYNANSMPTGIVFCMSYFLVLMLNLIKANKNDSLGMFMMGFIIAGSCVLYPPLAIVPLIHLPVWAGFMCISNREGLKAIIKQMVKLIAPYIVAIVAVLPYLLSITGSSEEPIIRIDFWDQSIRNFFSFWLPLPVIIAGIIFSLKQYKKQVLYFLLISTLVISALTFFTRVQHWNSVKFTFILSLFFAFFFITGISRLISILNRNIYKGIITGGIVMFLLLSPLVTETSYLISPWFKDETYAFDGRHIIFKRDAKRNEAFTWIRNNTSLDSLIMLSYTGTLNPDKIARNDTYEPAALTERSLFVIDDYYTVTHPEYKKRFKMRKKLLTEPLTAEIVEFFLNLNRPIYLLNENNLSSNYLRDLMFNDYRITEDDKFIPVFQNEDQKVYLLNIKD